MYGICVTNSNIVCFVRSNHISLCSGAKSFLDTPMLRTTHYDCACQKVLLWFQLIVNLLFLCFCIIYADKNLKTDQTFVVI